MNTDSVKVSVEDIRTATSIFLEHEKLKKQYALRLEEIKAKDIQLDTSLSIDSISTEQLKACVAVNEKAERKIDALCMTCGTSILLNAVLIIILLF